MDEKEALQKTIDNAREKLNAIKEKETYEKNKLLVGRFFKFRNNYSCPEPDEYWYLYLVVTGIDDDGDLSGWSFQTDYHGKVTIEEEKIFYSLSDGYSEISKDEFEKAWTSLKTKISLYTYS